jgi:hypothetical protein
MRFRAGQMTAVLAMASDSDEQPTDGWLEIWSDQRLWRKPGEPVPNFYIRPDSILKLQNRVEYKAKGFIEMEKARIQRDLQRDLRRIGDLQRASEGALNLQARQGTLKLSGAVYGVADVSHRDLGRADSCVADSCVADRNLYEHGEWLWFGVNPGESRWFLFWDLGICKAWDGIKAALFGRRNGRPGATRAGMVRALLKVPYWVLKGTLWDTPKTLWRVLGLLGMLGLFLIWVLKTFWDAIDNALSSSRPR